MSTFLRGISKFASSFISGVVIGLPIYITINDYVFCIARVEGTSMQPTLNPKSEKKCDVVLLNKWNFTYDNVKRGDIVALISPNNENVNFIKRIIGLEGDVVRTPRYKNDYVFIQRGHCWVEGDNKRSSLDSNSFGPIALGLVQGRATHIIWPPNRWQKLEHKIPQDREPTNLYFLKRRNKKINNLGEQKSKEEFKTLFDTISDLPLKTDLNDLSMNSRTTEKIDYGDNAFPTLELDDVDDEGSL